MGGYAIQAARLSADLLTIEDRFLWDARAELEHAIEYERRALALGDELLVARARLCQANMLMRSGDLATAASRVWSIHDWAVENGARQLQSRVHLVWAGIHRHLGDFADCLEHSLRSVELLDENATTHMQIWHRTKLADALGLAGSIEAARLRFAQTEELCVALDQPELLMNMLNNYAYMEYSAGNHRRAQQVAMRLLEIADDRGLDLHPAVLDTIGAIEIANGRFAQAERTMRMCIERHGEGQYEDADALPEYLLTLARAQRGLGATDRAQTSLHESHRLCVQRELGDVLVRVHQEQAELHAARGEFAEAFETHKMFFTAYNRQHSLQREAQARTRQAMFETAEARQDAERFREQARRDPLTGLHNRRYIDEQLPELIAAGGRLTLAIVDLDHFKGINDHLSHDVGDQVLVLVAKLLETELEVVCPTGFVARMGGEEFLIVLPDTDPSIGAAHLDTIREAVRSYQWNDVTRGQPVTVSIGVAGLADVTAPTQSRILALADRNLYVAKHGGRDQVVFGGGRDRRVRSYRDGVAIAGR